MTKQKVIEALKLHTDFRSPNDNSFLYKIRSNKAVSKNLFEEIMDLIVGIKDEFSQENDYELIKYIYSLTFWCRSWSSDGGFLSGTEDGNRLYRYAQILEETLYYLLQDDKEEAFFLYNEYLDGRF